MGRVMGIEPTNIGTTIRGLNRLATPAISSLTLKQTNLFFNYLIKNCFNSIFLTLSNVLNIIQYFQCCSSFSTLLALLALFDVVNVV